MKARLESMLRNLRQSKQKKDQAGFTLIELMIVVAIIGILAAIAIPQYQSYVARSQVSEAMQLAGSAKTAIAEYYQAEAAWPTSNAKAGVAETISGTYTASVVISNTTADDTTTPSVITVTMRGVSPTATAIQSKTIKITAGEGDSSIIWDCDPGDILESYVPSSCKAEEGDS
ncbi:pilin [Arenicellales bacterium IMCC58067]